MFEAIKLDVHEDERGQLVAIENARNIPFDIKRVFYIFNVKKNFKRAQHANMKAQEMIVCLSGYCEMLLDDGKKEHVNIKLSKKDEAIHIKPGTWIEIFNFSKDCLLLTMSDDYYDRSYQINNYEDFAEAVR